MLHVVPKTYYRENVKNKAMTASVYGHNFAVKFDRSELENFCYVYRFVLFFCVLLINFKMQIGFF